MRRLCEAPVSPRYVGRYRCEAIQCRERNIRTTYRRILRQPWIASPHIINYVSQVRRRLRNDGAPKGAPRAGQRPALSRRIAPGQWTGLRPRTARGGRV
ncbi:MAG: hypothetical protein LBM98_09885 [Oscillospiraceae bacterium]|nr:hypothetical protein [Oscillospiraceae bacterium]